MPHKKDIQYQTLEASLRAGVSLNLVQRVTARSIIRRVTTKRRTWDTSYIAPWTWVVG